MSDLSIDELLAKAEGIKKTRRRSENHTNVLKYIDNVNLVPGDFPVPTYFIHWHYKTQYTLCTNEVKAKKVVFFRTFSRRFPQYRKNKQRFYLLDTGTFSQFIEDGKIKEEYLKVAKAYDKNHGQRVKRKEKVRLSGQEGNSENAP